MDGWMELGDEEAGDFGLWEIYKISIVCLWHRCFYATVKKCRGMEDYVWLQICSSLH